MNGYYWSYRFQEDLRKKDDPDYVEKPYRGYLYFSWARMFIDNTFYYADLSCLAGYLFSMIEQVGFEHMDELIPHRYVDGRNHGKKEDGGFIFDKRLDAGGLEPQLEELRDRFFRYGHERYDALLDEFDQKASMRVYMIDQSDGVECVCSLSSRNTRPHLSVSGFGILSGTAGAFWAATKSWMH